RREEARRPLPPGPAHPDRRRAVDLRRPRDPDGGPRQARAGLQAPPELRPARRDDLAEVRRYLARRLLLLVPVLAGVSIVTALVLSTVIGLALGVASAAWPRSLLDRCSAAASLFGASMPSFWLGIVLMVIFALWLGWLPASGMFAPYGGGDTRDLFAHLVLPAVTLAAASVTIVARLTRSTMLEALGQDYIRTARAKGVAERFVVLRHGLKNALIPIVTVVGV